MKTVNLKYVFAFILTTILASCSSDKIIENELPLPDDVINATLSFNFLDSEDVLTRASNEDGALIESTPAVLVFTKVGNSNTEEFQYLADVSKNGEDQFAITFPKNKEEKVTRLAVVANRKVSESLLGKSYVEVVKELKFKIDKPWAGADSYLPMWGEKIFNSGEEFKSGSLYQMSLLRSVAGITIEFESNTTPAPLDVESVVFKNYQPECYIAPSNLQPSSSLVDKPFEVSAQNIPIYTPEIPLENNIQPAILVLKCKSSESSSGYYYYALRFKDADSKYIPIERNKKYVFKIKAKNGAGWTSLEDAIKYYTDDELIYSLESEDLSIYNNAWYHNGMYFSIASTRDVEKNVSFVYIRDGSTQDDPTYIKYNSNFKKDDLQAILSNSDKIGVDFIDEGKDKQYLALYYKTTTHLVKPIRCSILTKKGTPITSIEIRKEQDNIFDIDVISADADLYGKYYSRVELKPNEHSIVLNLFYKTKVYQRRQLVATCAEAPEVRFEGYIELEPNKEKATCVLYPLKSRTFYSPGDYNFEIDLNFGNEVSLIRKLKIEIPVIPYGAMYRSRILLVTKDIRSYSDIEGFLSSESNFGLNPIKGGLISQSLTVEHAKDLPEDLNNYHIIFVLDSYLSGNDKDTMNKISSFLKNGGSFIHCAGDFETNREMYFRYLFNANSGLDFYIHNYNKNIIGLSSYRNQRIDLDPSVQKILYANYIDNFTANIKDLIVGKSCSGSIVKDKPTYYTLSDSRKKYEWLATSTIFNDSSLKFRTSGCCTSNKDSQYIPGNGNSYLLRDIINSSIIHSNEMIVDYHKANKRSEYNPFGKFIQIMYR